MKMGKTKSLLRALLVSSLLCFGLLGITKRRRGNVREGKKKGMGNG